MKKAARVSLAIVLLLGAVGLLPRLGTTTALAGAPIPTPLLSDLVGEPKPKPSQEPTEDPGGGGGGPGGGGGDEDPDGSGGDDDGDRDRDGRDGRDGDGSGPGDGPGGRDGRDGRGPRGRGANVIPPSGTPRIPGSHTTDELMTIAAHLRSLGWSAEEVIDRVFPPFIIAGEATWIDTWGVPRYGPGPIVRTHEGQDVFCDFGDPILAPEAGVLSMSAGGLGGITSRVHLSDGSYWYMTHLSDWNTEEFSNGARVAEGDVIGYCGNSGNAETTPPHVHFGWYLPNGKSRDPMRRLIGWLDEAEQRAAGLIAAVEGARQKKLPALTAARRFGDAFAPDRSFLSVAAGESLWASGSVPEAGTFGLAEAALQAALAEQIGARSVLVMPASGEGAGDELLLDPDSRLARLLERRYAHNESGD